MKLTKLTAFLAGAAILFACTPDEDQPGGNGGGTGNKSNERTLLSISFDHQIGDAVITPVDDENGTVEFQLAIDLIDDLSQVEITGLTVSYGATATAKTGDKIDFTANNPTVTVTAESGKTRVYALQMAPFTESFAGNYAIQGSVIFGGLGDATSSEVWSWGCLLVDKPENKSWNWKKYNALGYGPTANYDNYLEIKCTKINDDGTTEGTCINYGGADGKHWNCFWDGEQNKDKPGQDLDLRHFYRVIPIGESTWKKDYSAGTITFTSAEGVVTVCAMFDEDIVICQDANKTVTVDKQCLAFLVDGDTTWNKDNEAYIASILGSDYLKWVIAPRYFFLMVEKVAEIPAESKVIGDEGDTEIEELPDTPTPDPGDEPEFSLADVPGNYKVKSLNLYGGLYANNFVDVKTKPWDWTNYDSGKGTSSANKEYDNTLTISADGKLNYGPGEDNEYWDYVYKDNNNNYGGFEVDLSFNYGILPHGESTYALNTETMVVTITAAETTVYGMLVGPGEQSVQNHDNANATEKLTIPAGCIGIAFQMTGYSGPAAEFNWDKMQYKDVDRFVFHPYYYVMVFEKQ